MSPMLFSLVFCRPALEGDTGWTDVRGGCAHPERSTILSFPQPLQVSPGSECLLVQTGMPPATTPGRELPRTLETQTNLLIPV